MNILRLSSSLATLLLAIPATALADVTTHVDQLKAYPSLALRDGAQGRFEVVAHPATQALRTMGYTDQAVPAEVPMPANMLSWMECVEKAAQMVDETPGLTLGTASASSTVIAPLLGPIKWNQDHPYNLLCPKGTPVGCVATAMAQVMYHYRYPEHGFGTHSIYYGDENLEADFENTYYRWNDMIDQYTGYSTPEEDYAVAELSYHCGIANNMQYAPEGSGAWLERVPYSMHKYFGYNSRACVQNRRGFTYEEWTERLTEELLAGRPIVFAANSSDVGHCFVIDGLNEEGLFHVNWGWGGWYNGYFDIGILNPEGTGIGGSNQVLLGYCLNQGAVFQLCPEEGLGEHLCPLSFDYYDWWGDLSDLSFTYTFQNNYGGSVRARLGLELIDEAGVCQAEIGEKTYNFGAYPYSNYWQYESYSFKGIDVPDGKYSCSMYCMIPDRDSTRFSMPHNKSYDVPWIMVENNTIVDFGEEQAFPNLTYTNFNYEGRTDFAVGRQYDFTFDLTNESDQTFVGSVRIFCRPYGVEHVSYDEVLRSQSDDLKLLPHETKTAHVPVCFDRKGEWEVWGAPFDFGYEMACAMEFAEGLVITSDYTAESPAALSLAATPELLTDYCEVDGDVAFRLVVDNEGGNFSDKLSMQFFTGKNATNSPSLVIERETLLEPQTTGNVIDIEGKLTGLKGKTKYFARPFYMNEKGQYQQLLPSVGKSTAIEVKVYNATGIEQIEADADADAPIYDLMGRRVNEAQPGFSIQRHATSLR